MKTSSPTTTAGALVLASALLQACAARATATPTPAPATPVAPPAGGGARAPGLASIAGTTWTLVELDGKPVTATDRGPTLSIDGSRASGHSGCNRWGADVSAPGVGEWALGPIASTRMACEEDEMKLEQRFLSALAATSRWRVEGSRLLVSGADGKVRLAFSGQRPG
jgi:heat shock protein HslJ